MSYQRAAQIMGSLGLKPTVAIDNTELPPLRSLQDLQELHAKGQQELETQGYSRAYQQAVKAYAMGLDSTLPDLEIAGTGVGKTMDAINAEAALASSRQAQYFHRETVNPILQTFAVNGVVAAEQEVSVVRDFLNAALIDVPDHDRGPLMEALAAIDDSPHGSMGMSVEWSLPETGLTVEANAASYEDGSDFYQDWRNGASMNPDHGDLGSLAIKPSVGPGWEFSGVVEMSGSGGRYERSSDWALDAAIAQATAQDFHQDGANTFAGDTDD